MKRISLIPPVVALFCLLFIPSMILQAVSMFILGIYGFPWLVSKYLYFSVEIKRDGDVYYCENGSRSTTSLRIRNKGFFPLSNLIVYDKGSGCYNSSGGVFLADIPMRGTKDFVSDLITIKRGIHQIGPVLLKGGDPFNFFPWVKTIHNYSDVIVYPAYQPLSLILGEGERGGVCKSHDYLYEDQNVLKGIKDYRPGDSLNRVNWKASAKSGTLQTMEFSSRLSSPLMVLLDVCISRYPLKQRYNFIERAIEATASLIYSYGEKKQKCGLMIAGTSDEKYIAQGKGYHHIISLLELLAKIKLSEDPGEQSIISQYLTLNLSRETGTHIFVLVPELTGDLLREIEVLHRRRCIINLVLTGGGTSENIPEYCNAHFLTDYGRDYFNE